MYRLSFVAFILTLIFCSSCRNDFETVPSNGNLSFSKDTVYLDTTFTNIGSATYTLKVYNRSKKDLHIPEIKLGKGNDSQYRLMVDGKPGKTFKNVELLAQDSLFIFVETTIDYDQLAATENSFLYTDRIEFDNGSNQQKVELVTLVKDAVFLYPSKDDQGNIETVVLNTDDQGNENRTQGFVLQDDQLNWNNQKPYVVYGYAVVPDSKILNITAGARIHFHNNSGLLISDNASIQAKGALSTTKALENEIIFEGDKLQSLYDFVTGQWGTIWLKPNSVNNLFEHTTIKNGTIGIRTEAQQNDALQLKNVQIYNHSNFGIFGLNAFIDSENTVVHNAGQSSLGLFGGNYHFKHATITNYWNSGNRKGRTLNISNQFNEKTYPLQKAQFDNCIIYGNGQLELGLDKNDSETFNYLFSNCLIRFNDVFNEFKNNVLYDFNNPLIMNQIVLNKNPEFKDTSKNNLIIGKNSGAIGLANETVSALIPTDILGTARTLPADLGAYQADLTDN